MFRIEARNAIVIWKQHFKIRTGSAKVFAFRFLIELVYPMQTQDFSEDVGIIVNALHTNDDLPSADHQESLPRPTEEQPRYVAERAVVETQPVPSVDIDEEISESWPQPPTLLELQLNQEANR